MARPAPQRMFRGLGPVSRAQGTQTEDAGHDTGSAVTFIGMDVSKNSIGSGGRTRQSSRSLR